jgi:1,4-dihydroxy-2-naphthoyl-CoA hydrolase
LRRSRDQREPPSPGIRGRVTGIARPIHLGRTTQVWEIRITDERDKLVCIARVTMAVLATAMQY